MFIRQKIYNLPNLFSVSEKHHTPTFKPTHSSNNMSKSSVMSKAIQAIVICIIFTNFSRLPEAQDRRRRGPSVPPAGAVRGLSDPPQGARRRVRRLRQQDEVQPPHN